MADEVTVTGFGFFSNADVTLTFKPASPDTGRIFVRTDLNGSPEIPATIEHAVEKYRRTALQNQDAHVELTEHVLAALSGLWIDNCLIEMNGPEPPGGDGSAKHFVDAILDTGIEEQDQLAAIFEVPSQLSISGPQYQIEAIPNASPLANRLTRRRLGAARTSERFPFHLTYHLDYDNSSIIPTQSASIELTPETFANEIAFARTFILESEVDGLRKMGYGEKVSTRDLLVFGESGIIDNELRADNECARHKLLDCIGDFALIGGRIAGRISANRSGHTANREFIRHWTESRRIRQAA